MYTTAPGYFQVTAFTNSTVTLLNLGCTGKAAAGTLNVGTNSPIAIVGAPLATATTAWIVPTLPNDATKIFLGRAAFGTLAYTSLSSSVLGAEPTYSSLNLTAINNDLSPDHLDGDRRPDCLWRMVENSVIGQRCVIVIARRIPA
jgi:hypothetical protein